MTGTANSYDAIANIAQLQEEEAANVLADSIARKQQAEKQLSQLETYLQDYQKQQNSDSTEKKVYKVRNEHLFYQRINFLIDKQKQEITAIQNSIDAAIEDWKANKIYNKVLNRLIDKYREDQTNLLEQYEQKVSDDFSSNYAEKNRLQ